MIAISIPFLRAFGRIIAQMRMGAGRMSSDHPYVDDVIANGPNDINNPANNSTNNGAIQFPFRPSGWISLAPESGVGAHRRRNYVGVNAKYHAPAAKKSHVKEAAKRYTTPKTTLMIAIPVTKFAFPFPLG